MTAPLSHRDRCLILHGSVEGIGEIMSIFAECVRGARQAAEEAQREAVLVHDAEMTAWEGGFLAGLLASDLFVARINDLREGLKRQYRAERDAYLREKGMGDATNN